MNTESAAVVKREQKYKTLVTAIGNEKIRNAVLNGIKVNIVSAAVGDGAGSYYTPHVGMTSLVNEVWRGPIAGVNPASQSKQMIAVKIVIPGNAGGFTVRECGIFDDEGNLIAVCNIPDTEKAEKENGIAAALTILMHIVITSSEALEFVLDPSIDTASAISANFAIAQEAWEVASTESGNTYKYCAEAACIEATSLHTPIVTLSAKSLTTAGHCGLCQTVETVNSALRFWAIQIPHEAIEGSVLLIGQGGGNRAGDGSYVLPAATPFRLGGVIVEDGSGLQIDKDGRISIDIASDDEVFDAIDDTLGESASEDDTINTGNIQVAADNEVSDMINDIFG